MATACKARPFGLNLRQCTSSLSIRTTAAPRCRGLSPLSKRPYSTSDSLPKIADTSVWTSMVPKFIRNLGSRKERKPSVSNEWNPATFYIIIFTLIGSQAIRMIALKNSYANYRRSTDAKIELLREVIERVKRGEKVDVEKLLGTGDEAKEREWEEVLREIEAEDSLWHQKKSAETASSQQSDKDAKQPTQKSQEKDSVVPATAGADDETMQKTQSTRKLNFF